MNKIEGQTSRVIYTINRRPIPRPCTPGTSDQHYPTETTLVQPSLSGTIYINESPNSSPERVKVVISLRKLTKTRPVKEWTQINQRRQPTTVNQRGFTVDRTYRLNSKGINWVVPTPLFGETSIKISLEASALLSTGFILEVFRRIKHEVQPSADLTIGCNINFKISWNLSTNPVGATPTINQARWAIRASRSESHRSIASLASGDSFQLNHLGINSDDQRTKFISGKYLGN